MIIKGRYMVLPHNVDAMKLERFIARVQVKPDLQPKDDWETETEPMNNTEGFNDYLDDINELHNGIVIGMQLNKSCIKNSYFKIVIKMNTLLQSICILFQSRCRNIHIDCRYTKRFFIRKIGTKIVFRWMLINNDDECTELFTDCIKELNMKDIVSIHPLLFCSKIKTIEKSKSHLSYYIRNFSKHSFLF